MHIYPSTRAERWIESHAGRQAFPRLPSPAQRAPAEGARIALLPALFFLLIMDPSLSFFATLFYSSLAFISPSFLSDSFWIAIVSKVLNVPVPLAATQHGPECPLLLLYSSALLSHPPLPCLNSLFVSRPSLIYPSKYLYILIIVRLNFAFIVYVS